MSIKEDDKGLYEEENMIEIKEELCIGCGQCAADCVADNIVIQDHKAHVIRRCFECGHCLAICPTHAVSFPGYSSSEIKEYEVDSFLLRPENVLNAIKFRRSIRNFKNQAIEKETLEHIIQAGRYTATAKNNQGTRFVVVQKDLATLKQLVWGHIASLIEEYGAQLPEELRIYRVLHKRYQKNSQDDYLFKNAPAVMYLSSDWPLDAGLAAQNIETMANSLGIGILYNGYLERISEHNSELKQWLSVEDTTIKACLLLGYPAITYKRTVPRKNAHIIWR